MGEITGALQWRSASAFRTSVTDGIQQVLNCCCGLLGRKTKQRVFASDEKGPLAGMRIGAILHPAVCLAFADSVSFEQNASCPSLDRTKAGRRSLVISMNCSNAARDESVTLVSGSADSTEPGYRRNYWFSTCSERLDARLELLLLRRFGLSKKTKAKKAKTSRRLKQDRLGSRGGQRHEVGYEVRSLAASVKSAVKMVGNSRTRVERPSEG